MELRGKQKRFLRAQANKLTPIFAIGKEGLSQQWLAQLDGALDRRELIKVNILQNSMVTVAQAKSLIEHETDIQCVQTIGRTLVLFKVSNNKDYRDLSKRVAKI